MCVVRDGPVLFILTIRFLISRKLSGMRQSVRHSTKTTRALASTRVIKEFTRLTAAELRSERSELRDEQKMGKACLGERSENELGERAGRHSWVKCLQCFNCPADFLRKCSSLVYFLISVILLNSLGCFWGFLFFPKPCLCGVWYV